MQVQHIRLDSINGLTECSPKPQCHGGIDQIELHWDTVYPWWVIRQRGAVHKCMRVDALATLLLDQVCQKHFHSTHVRREELADVDDSQSHVWISRLGQGLDFAVDLPLAAN